MQDFEDQAKDAEKRRSSLCDKLDSMCKEVESVNRENSRLFESSSKLGKANQDLENRVDELEKQVTDYISSNAALKAGKCQLGKRLKGLSDTLAKVQAGGKNANMALAKENLDLKKDLLHLEESLEMIPKLQSELHACKKQRDFAEKKVAGFLVREKEAAKLKSKMKNTILKNMDLTKENEELKNTALKRSAREIPRLKTEIKNLTRENRRLEKDGTAAKEAYAQAVFKSHTQLEQAIALENEATTVTLANKKLQKLLDARKSELAQLQRKRASLANEVKELKTRLNVFSDLKNANIKLNTELVEATTKVKKLTAKMDELTKDYETRFRETDIKYKESSLKSNQELTTIQKDLRKFRTENSELSGKLNETLQSLTRQEEKHRRLRDYNEDSIRESKMASAKLEGKTQDFIALQAKHREAELENTRLTKQLSSHKSDFENLEEKHDKLKLKARELQTASMEHRGRLREELEEVTHQLREERNASRELMRHSERQREILVHSQRQIAKLTSCRDGPVTTMLHLDKTTSKKQRASRELADIAQGLSKIIAEVKDEGESPRKNVSLI